MSFYVMSANEDWNNGKKTIVAGPFSSKLEAQTHCYDNSCWLELLDDKEVGNKVY